MTEVQAKAAINQLRIVGEPQYVDAYFGEMNKTLTSLAHCMKSAEEITKKLGPYAPKAQYNQYGDSYYL